MQKVICMDYGCLENQRDWMIIDLGFEAPKNNGKIMKKMGVLTFDSAVNSSLMNTELGYRSVPIHWVVSGECEGFVDAPETKAIGLFRYGL